MPLSPLHSQEWLQQIAVPPLKTAPHKAGKLYIQSASHVFTGAGQGTAKMLRLPPGKLRIWSHLSRITCPAGAAGSTLSLGFPTYVKEDGTTAIGGGRCPRQRDQHGECRRGRAHHARHRLPRCR